jgi:hypothetical protein
MKEFKHSMVVIFENLNFRIHPKSSLSVFEEIRERLDRNFLMAVDTYLTENEMFELKITIARKKEHTQDELHQLNLADFEHDLVLSMDDSDPIDFSKDKYDNYPSDEPLPF